MRLLLRYRFAHAMPKDMPCHTMLCYVLICYALSCHSWLQQPLNWLSVRCPAAVACCCNSRLLIVCCCCYYCRLTNVRVAFTSSTRFIFAFFLYAPFTCEPGFHVVVVIVVVIVAYNAPALLLSSATYNNLPLQSQQNKVITACFFIFVFVVAV